MWFPLIVPYTTLFNKARVNNMQVSQSVNFERKHRKIREAADTVLSFEREESRMAREKSIREGRKTKHLHSDMETI